MCNDPSFEGRMLAIHQVLAFLLARESVTTGKSMVNIGNSLKESIVSAIEKASPKILEHTNHDTNSVSCVSESASFEIDSIFKMAEAFYSIMPDK